MKLGNETVSAPPLKGFLFDNNGNRVGRGSDLIPDSDLLYYGWLDVRTTVLFERYKSNIQELENDPEFKSVSGIVSLIKREAKDLYKAETPYAIKKLFDRKRFDVRNYDSQYNFMVRETIKKLRDLEVKLDQLTEVFASFVVDIVDGRIDGKVDGKEIEGGYEQFYQDNLENIAIQLQCPVPYLTKMYFKDGAKVLRLEPGKCASITVELEKLCDQAIGEVNVMLALDGNATFSEGSSEKSITLNNENLEGNVEVCLGETVRSSEVVIVSARATYDDNKEFPVSPLIIISKCEKELNVEFAGVEYIKDKGWKVAVTFDKDIEEEKPQQLTFKILTPAIATFEGGRRVVKLDEIEVNGNSTWAMLDVKSEGKLEILAMVVDPCGRFYARVIEGFVSPEPCAVKSVSLNATKTSLTAGDSTQLTAQVQVVAPEICGDLSGKQVNFEVVSGDGAVNPATAVTGANGTASTTLTVNAPGEVKVKATSEGRSSNEVTIKVAQDPCTVTGIDVQAEPATVCAGANSTIKATVHLADYDACSNKDVIGDAAFEVTQGDGTLSPQATMPIAWKDVDKVGVAAVTLTAGNQASTVRVTVDGVSGETSVGVTQPKAYICTLKIGVTANGTIGGVDVTVDYSKTGLGFDNVKAIGAAQGATVVPADNGTYVRVGLIYASGFTADGSAVLEFTFLTPQNQGVCAAPQQSDVVITEATCSDLNGNTFTCQAQIVEFTCR